MKARLNKHQTNKGQQQHQINALSERVLDAAFSLLSEADFESLSPENIVKRSKIDASDFARLFPDDRTLWSALLARIHHRLMYLLEHAMVGRNGSLEQVFRSHVSFISKCPAIPKLLHHFSQSDDPQLRSQVVRIITGYESELSILLSQAKTAGEIRADVDVRVAAMLFVTMIHGLVFRALMTDEMKTIVTCAENVLPIYLAGIRSEGIEVDQ